MIEAKAFRTFIGIYSLIINEPLSANIKLTLHKTPIKSIMICVCPASEFASDTSFEVASSEKQYSPHYWQISKAHTGSRFVYGFQSTVYLWLRNRIT
jgi:hypothetical protein